MATVPGITDKHCVITPSCQERRKANVMRDTIGKVKESLNALLDHYDPEDGAAIRVVVNVEKDYDNDDLP